MSQGRVTSVLIKVDSPMFRIYLQIFINEIIRSLSRCPKGASFCPLRWKCCQICIFQHPRDDARNRLYSDYVSRANPINFSFPFVPGNITWFSGYMDDKNGCEFNIHRRGNHPCRYLLMFQIFPDACKLYILRKWDCFVAVSQTIATFRLPFALHKLSHFYMKNILFAFA